MPPAWVLVAVSEDNGSELVSMLLQEGDVGDDEIHTQTRPQMPAGESHAGIDQDHVPIAAERGTVHPELA